MTQRYALLFLGILTSWTLAAQTIAVQTSKVRPVRQHQPSDVVERGGEPLNDLCADISASALVPDVELVFTGDNTGATLDDPPVSIGPDAIETPAVWEAFTTTGCMDVTISYCGTLFGGTVLTALFTGCDQAGIARAAGSDNTTCTDGQVTYTLRRLPAGTYYIPVVADIDGIQGAYTITVLGTACTEPAVASDECGGSVLLLSGSSCTPVSTDVLGATESLPAATCSGFTGTADEDVWFSFVASTTSQQVQVQGSAGFDAVVELFEGSCGTLTSLGCVDDGLDGDLEAALATDLTIGNTYYFRVYDWYVGLATTTTVEACVLEVPAVAANDDCPGTTLIMGTECNATLGTVAGATQSEAPIECATFTGESDDDVWHSFVATATNVVIAAQGGTDFDMVLELLSGTCGTPTNLGCADATVANEVEQIDYSGLTLGNTYYVRLYSYSDVAVMDPTYSICIFGVAPPANEECANAQVIEVNEAVECPAASVEGNNAFAAVSTDQPSCDELSTAGYADVWYTFNSLGNNLVTVTFTDISMEDAGVEVIDACTGGTAAFCDFGSALTDPVDVPVATNTDYYVRVWSNLDFGAGGEFGLCVSGAISTAVQEEVTSTWSIYPNPNDGRFQLVNGGAAMNGFVQLFDATGREVMSERVAVAEGGVFSIDQASRLAQGTYSLRITTNEARYEQRVMVR